jgi:ABC-type cobalamin/Fe3+-siderophores transport system ATPase subunit
MTPLLSFDAVGKRFRRGDLTNWLLRRVTLHVDPGEVVSVVALRSQGKTTLLRIAAGILAPEEGRVLFDGTDLAGLSDTAQSRVLREPLAWASRSGPGLSVRMLDYVALRLAVGGRGHRREVRSSALRALDRIGVEHTADRLWSDLSDQERALVEIAQAIAASPRLLLIDDLFDGLGMRETEEISLLVRALAEELSLGVLMTVSDPEPALCSHRVLSLADGRLSVMADVRDPVVANVVDLDLHRPRRPGARGAGRP